MNGATWRRRSVSLSSCQPQGISRFDWNIGGLLWLYTECITTRSTPTELPRSGLVQRPLSCVRYLVRMRHGCVRAAGHRSPLDGELLGAHLGRIPRMAYPPSPLPPSSVAVQAGLTRSTVAEAVSMTARRSKVCCQMRARLGERAITSRSSSAVSSCRLACQAAEQRRPGC
jgi:hypothetical protein